MNRAEKAFMRVTDFFNLNPSTWIPHIKPNGIYEMGSVMKPIAEVEAIGEDADVDDWFEDEGVPIESFSIYSVFWNICYNRREGTDRPPSRWEALWGFLSEVDMGVYDTTNWVHAPCDEHWYHVEEST